MRGTASGTSRDPCCPLAVTAEGSSRGRVDRDWLSRVTVPSCTRWQAVTTSVFGAKGVRFRSLWQAFTPETACQGSSGDGRQPLIHLIDHNERS